MMSRCVIARCSIVKQKETLGNRETMLEKKRAVRYRATSSHVQSLGTLPLVVTAMCCACHVIQAEEEVSVSHKETFGKECFGQSQACILRCDCTLGYICSP